MTFLPASVNFNVKNYINNEEASIVAVPVKTAQIEASAKVVEKYQDEIKAMYSD